MKEPLNLHIQEVTKTPMEEALKQNLNFAEDHDSVLLAKISVIPPFNKIKKKPPSESIKKHLTFIL